MSNTGPGALNEINAFGHTLHGLLKTTGGSVKTIRMGGTWFDVDTLTNGFSGGINYGINNWDSRGGDTHMVKVPDVADVSLSPSVVASELVAGRAWQNYALISGQNLSLFTKPMNGWIWIDPNGLRRHVAPDILFDSVIDPSDPLGMTITLRPFGNIGLFMPPDASSEITCSLADIGQQLPDTTYYPTVTVQLESVASHGRQALYGIYEPGTPSEGGCPSGWLMLTLSLSGLDPVATLTVHLSRADALGTVGSYSDPEEIVKNLILPVTFADLETDIDSRHRIGATFETGSVSWVDGTTTLFGIQIGEQVWQSSRSGRVCKVIFDDSDTLVSFSFDYEFSLRHIYDDPTLGAISGAPGANVISGWLTTGSGFPEWTAEALTYPVYSPSVSYSQDYRCTVDHVLSLYRDGSLLETVEGSLEMEFSREGVLKNNLFVESSPVGTISPPWLSSVAPDPSDFTVYLVLKTEEYPTRHGYSATLSSNGSTLVSAGYSGSVTDWSTAYYMPPIAVQPAAVFPLFNAYWSNNDVDPAWAATLPSGQRYLPNAGAGFSFRRMNNQMIIGIGRELPTSATYEVFHPHAYASQAQWDSPSPDTPYTASLGGTYNPATHEIAIFSQPPASSEQYVFI